MKKKNLTFSIILVCILTGSIVFGMVYQNLIRNDDVHDDDFIGESPRIMRIIPNPDPDGIVYILWYQIENATSYNIYRNMDGGSYELIVQIIHKEGFNLGFFKDAGLVSGRYGYKVKAIHTNGESDFSNIEFVDVQLILDTYDDEHKELMYNYRILTGDYDVIFDNQDDLEVAYNSVCGMIKQAILPVQYSIFAEAVRRYYMPIYIDGLTRKEVFIGYAEFCRDIILHDSGQYNAFSDVSDAFSDALKFGRDTMALANFTMSINFDWSNIIDYWGLDELVSYNNLFSIDIIVQNCIDEIDYEYELHITYTNYTCFDDLYYYINDYIKFPVETAFRTMGDCEDQAILVSAYLESCGFETMFAAFHDPNHPTLESLYHGVLLVNIDDINDFYSKYPSGSLWSFGNDINNNSWCFIDTTWDVPFGSNPSWLQDYIEFGGITTENITIIYSDINGIVGEDINLKYVSI